MRPSWWRFEAEDAVQGDLAVVLQTRNTKTSGLLTQTKMENAVRSRVCW